MVIINKEEGEEKINMLFNFGVMYWQENSQSSQRMKAVLRAGEKYEWHAGALSRLGKMHSAVVKT